MSLPLWRGHCSSYKTVLLLLNIIKKSLKGGISNAVSIIYYTKARTIDLRKIVVGYIPWAFDLTTPLCSEGYLFQRTWSSKAVIVKTIFTCDVVLV